ncbi:arylesterase [Pseudorhodoplanes sinuspersici]|nr:arylesterase [Pseudorhodoplanes sinuspersici]RKE69426.1 acyl-CoA thioesterase-1 [Pseudorhodoplanes sinuspersici]
MGLIHSVRLFAAMLLVFAAALWIAPVAAQPLSPDVPLKIVAFGDSLTAGYGLPAQDAFPAKLERALKAKGINVEIENAGVSGDTASGGLSRIDWSIPDGTDAVILELGANDMLRGIDPKVTRAALDSILAKLKERNIAVLLCGMRAAPNLGGEYARGFESIFDDLTRKYDVVFYPFFLDGVATQAKLALRDGLHPNAAGVDAIVAGIMPKVEELIARLGRNKSRS